MSSDIKKFQVLLDLHKYEELLEGAYTLLYSSDEDEYLLYRYIIVAHLFLKEYDKALEITQEALAHYPSSAFFCYLLSETHFALGVFGDATLAIKEALSIEPSTPTYLAHYAKLLFVQKKFIEAKEQIEKALELDATEASYHLMLARILYMLDAEKLCCEIVQSVLAKEPHNEEALDMQQEYCTATLKGKKQILQNILSLNPFDSFSQKDIRSIEHYHKYIPLSMAVFLLFHYLTRNGLIVSGAFEMVLFFTFMILGALGSKEKLFNLPFIAVALGINSYFKVGRDYLDIGDVFAILILSVILHYFLFGLRVQFEHVVLEKIKKVFKR